MGTVGGKVGCGAALVAGLLAFAPLMFWNFYGDCGPDPDPRCGQGEDLRFLIVLAIVAAVAAAVGFGVRFVVNWWAGLEK